MRVRRNDPALALETLILVVLVRLGLTLSSLQTVQGRLLRHPRSGVARDLDVARIARGVSLAAMFVPGASCLTQAVSYQVLLHRRGVPSELKLGVRRVGDRGLAAHAWVTVDGQVRLGGSQIALAGFSQIAKFGNGDQ